MQEEAAEDGGAEAGSASGPTIRTQRSRVPVITGTEPSAGEVSTYERRAYIHLYGAVEVFIHTVPIETSALANKI